MRTHPHSRSARSGPTLARLRSDARRVEMLTLSGPALIVLLLIAAVCGALGKALAGGSRGGLITSIALGFIGAVFGTWVGRELRLPEPLIIQVGGQPFPVVWSIVGAGLIVAILHVIMRPRSFARV